MSTAKRDYYEVLGVPRSATDDEIKQAYRQLARRYHPDVSKMADAEERFKELGEAYEVLGDPQMRPAYDARFVRNGPRSPFRSNGGGAPSGFGRGVQQRAAAERERREQRRAEAERREQAERERQPQGTVQYYNRGRDYAAKGDYDRAIQDYNQALRSAPNFAAAYYSRGLAYTAKGDYDRAIQDYNQALQLTPSFAAAYYNRGLAYKRKGEYEWAKSDFNKALTLGYDRATVEALLAELRREQAEREREKRDICYDRGNSHARNGRYDRAIQDYNQALQHDPSYVPAYNNRGVAWAVKGQYNRAIRDYDQALRLDPSYVAAYNNRGKAYARKGDYDRAIRDYDRALGRNPNYVAAYCERGIAYAAKGNYDRAIQDYNRALRRAPSFAAAYYNRGLAYKRKGEYEWARRDFSKALELGYDRATVEAFLAELRRKRAEAAEQERQRRAEEEERERREQAEAAERERRERAEQYTNQGRVYAAKGNYDQARKCLHKALGLGYGRATVEALLAELRQERERRETGRGG